jgi:HTH-type transcriptional regulator / antitoxin MqsA
MAETRIHPVTGKELSRGVRVQTVSFGVLSKDVEVPGWYPNDDSDSIHSGADLEAKEAALMELRKAYGAHVREIRKKLKLTQVEAGTILGGGERAFQKYESGSMAPSDAAIGLLEVLRAKPEMLDILKRIRQHVPADAVKGSQEYSYGVKGRRSRRESLSA